MRYRIEDICEKLIKKIFSQSTGTSIEVEGITDEDYKQAAKSFNLRDFLFNKYPMNPGYNEAENIKKLSQLLTHLFIKFNTLRIFLDAEIGIDSLADLRQDYYTKVYPVDSWKFKALCKALETNNTILELSLINHIINTENAAALSHLLKVTAFIKILSVHNDVYTDKEIGEILADGIKHNHGLKSVEFEALKSYESVDLILDAIKFNNIIDFGYFEDYSLQPAREQKLANFIETTPNIINLATSLWHHDCITPSALIQEAVIKNNNLNKISDWNLEFNIDTLQDIKYIYANFEKYEYFRKLILYSQYLEKVPYFRNNYSTMRVIPYLSEEKREQIFKIADFFNTLDFTSPPAPHYIKWFIEYEKIGKGLLKEKLKKVNWADSQIIQKYAALRNIDTLNDYDFSVDFPTFSKPQLENWEYVFETLVSFIDPEEEKSASFKLIMIERYHNNNFFYFKGVCKDIENTGYSKNIWSLIAFYAGLENPHPAPDNSATYHAVIENVYKSVGVNTKEVDMSGDVETEEVGMLGKEVDMSDEGG